MADPKSVNELKDVELDAEVRHLLHLLWGHCHESPEYDKPAWGRFSQCLDRVLTERKPVTKVGNNGKS